MIDRTRVLPHRIAELARESGEVNALLDVDGRVASWRDVHESSLRWASAFRRLGLEQGATVVTMLPNSFEAYYAWLGAAWLRVIEVPANNMYRGEMLRYLITNAHTRVLVIAQRFVDRLTMFERIEGLETVVVPDAEGELPDLPYDLVRGDTFLGNAEPLRDAVGPDYWDIGAMIYTSGTTGPSKGVLVPWGELYQWPMFLPDDFLEAGDAFYTAYPPSHLSGKCALYCAADRLCSLVIRETLSVTEFWNDMRTFDIRSAMLVGPMAAMLLASPPAEDDATNPLDRILLGPIIADLDEFTERFGVKKVFTGYGTTEIGWPICSPWNPSDRKSCGRLRQGPPHYEIRIVDQHDELVPEGIVGELIIRARDPWVMNQGYWNMPEITAEAWRNGWFHTGDGFVERDGWFTFVDRMKDTLRRRGENISSFEVEMGVLGHPAVAECAVIGVPSELGEEDIKAVVVLKSDARLSAPELIEFLEPRMPRFMIPRFVQFVEALPKTDGTFRVRKILLRDNPIGDDTWDRQG
ncbi:MAG: AMP-binding protein [Mycobacterium sp.]|uniref:AMP-binding protein n=1 Tax=Mycobacterium sp. TaxID=1785 RepID=UPI003C4C3448